MNNNKTKKHKLSAAEGDDLIATLRARFEENAARHKGIKWPEVEERLRADSQCLWTLSEMERTGGEPDVVGYDKQSDKYVFYDCSAESPKGRRSLCFDQAAWESRKEHKPASSAEALADEMGVELLSEEEYRDLQKLGEFDLKTSSWVATPPEMRKLGGALFCDRRFDRVFTYHNGAESYYAARGFRSSVRI